MTKFLNKTFSVGPQPGEKITDEQWAVATDAQNPAKGSFDGGSSSNPGEGAWAFALEYADKTTMAHTGPMGIVTNNEAEYVGLINLLTYALEHQVSVIRVTSDSQLVVEQVKGNWKVKAEHLKPLAAQAQALAKEFKKFEIVWVPREENEECDALVKATIKDAKSATTPRQQRTK